MMQAVFQTATVDDHAALALTLGDMLADMQSYGGLPLADEATCRAHIDELLQHQLVDPLCRYFIARQADQAVAMIGVQIRTPDAVFAPVRRLHVSAIYVRPSHRRQGLGLAMIRHALEWARAEGCTQAQLNVLVGNPAGRLYERLGFEPVEQKMVLREFAPT